jgi:Protein of unknown function (DUF3433)
MAKWDNNTAIVIPALLLKYAVHTELPQFVSHVRSFGRSQSFLAFKSVMSIPLEHIRSSSASQLMRNPPSEEFLQTKEARSHVRSLPDQIVITKWRPWTLHPAVLIATLSFTLGVIGILEYLQRFSDANHGISFAPTRDAFSTTSTFFYLYFPTLIAVLFSTWWSWVDLDVKRLEPWYQLICARKTNARCSLLLQYPVEFLAWIPFRAAKRR